MPCPALPLSSHRHPPIVLSHPSPNILLPPSSLPPSSPINHFDPHLLRATTMRFITAPPRRIITAAVSSQLLFTRVAGEKRGRVRQRMPSLGLLTSALPAPAPPPPYSIHSSAPCTRCSFNVSTATHCNSIATHSLWSAPPLSTVKWTKERLATGNDDDGSGGDGGR